MTTFNTLITPIGENYSIQEILIQQLATGNRITSPYIDAGGLAVATKLESSISRTTFVANNLATSNSFLQTQDGVLTTASEIVSRIGELKAMSEGIFGDNTGAYQTEFEVLRDQLANLSGEQFNGIDLFSNAGDTLTVISNETATAYFDIDQADIENAVIDITSETNLVDLAMDSITGSLQNIANLRASNGAQQSQILAAFDLMLVNHSSLNVAYSAIIDVDYARTITDLALAAVRGEAGISVFSDALTTASAVDTLLL
jgi:flagellin